MWLWRWRLSAGQKLLLVRLGTGWTLKAQRDIEGRKSYWLITLTGKLQSVDGRDVNGLIRHGLVYSNHKFPANSYLLTNRGRRLVLELTGQKVRALGSNVQVQETWTDHDADDGRGDRR